MVQDGGLEFKEKDIGGGLGHAPFLAFIELPELHGLSKAGPFSV